jgi:tetratricopeptide (TPR) repeat protein
MPRTTPPPLLSILTAILTLLVLSCSDNQAVRLRYEAERAFVRAERQLMGMQSSSKAMRTQSSQGARDGFRQAMQLSISALDSVDASVYPKERSELEQIAYESTAQLAALHVRRQQYDSSVAILEDLLRHVELNGRRRLAARFRFGQNLQLASQWDSALAVYDALLTDAFPPLDKGGDIDRDLLGLPLHLTWVSLQSDDTQYADMWRERAEEYYLSLLTYRDDHPLAAAARTHLASLYEIVGEPQTALAHLDTLIATTPSARIPALVAVADIFANDLDRPDTAVTLLGMILLDVPLEDTLLRPELELKTALALIDQKQCDRARTILIDLKRNSTGFYSRTPLIQKTIARSFELQGKWSRAETEYKFLIEKYRDTDEAVLANLHMADHVASQGRSSEQEYWMTSAKDQLSDMARRGAGGQLEAQTMYLRAEMALSDGRPDRAVEILTELLHRFPKSIEGHRGLRLAVEIMASQPHRKTTVDSLMNFWKSSQINSGNWSGRGILFEPRV